MTHDDADMARERAAALLAGPTACAFLLLADANELPPAVAAHPPVAFALAANACNATDPWAVDDIDAAQCTRAGACATAAGAGGADRRRIRGGVVVV